MKLDVAKKPAKPDVAKKPITGKAAEVVEPVVSKTVVEPVIAAEVTEVKEPECSHLRGPVKCEKVGTPGKLATPKKPKRQSLNPTKRRRTRFSMNKVELEKQLKEFEQEEGAQGHELTLNQPWGELAQGDAANTNEQKVIQDVKRIIKEFTELHLPLAEAWDALDELRNCVPKV